METTALAGTTMRFDSEEARRRCESFLAGNLGLLYRVAASYEAVPARCEDLLQDIVLAIWQAAPRFEERSSFKTFALRVAHNRGLSHCARESRRPRDLSLDDHPQADAGPGPERHAEQAHRQAALLAAVRGLPVAQRQVLGLALEGLSYREIGEVLDLSANNVGVRLNRAKQALKERLDG